MPLVTPSTVQIVIDAQNKADAKFAEVMKDIDKLEKEVDDFSEKSGTMTGATDEAAVSFDTLKMAAAAYTATMALLTAAVATFIKAYQVGEIAAQNERLIAAGQEMASQYGGSMDLIVEKVRNASLNTVSDLDIIASANKAIMLGLGADAETLANLMEIAAFRARAMGISTTQAFDDIVRGIGRSSPLILDNLGIVVKLGEVNEKYAEGLGKTTQELTAAEKKQALLNAVLDEGNAMLAKAGGLAEDNASAYEQFNAELENTKALLTGNLIGMTRFASMGRDLLIVFQELAENGIGYGAEKLNLFSLAFGTMEKRVIEGRLELQEMTLAGTAWENNQKNNLVLLGDLTAGYEEHNEVIAMTDEEIKKMTEANQGYLDTISSINGEIEKYASKEEDLKAKHDELIAKKEELIAQGWYPEGEKITEINAKLAENDLAMQKNAAETELAGRRRILSMLEQQLAIDGLDARETDYLLSLGLKWGVYSQSAVDAARAAMAEVNELKAALDNTPSEKTIRILMETGGGGTLVGQSTPSGDRKVYASGSHGWQTVPAGYKNDTYPILLSSGERFAVVPSGAPATGYANGTGGGQVINITIASPVTVMDRNSAVENLRGYVAEAMRTINAEGYL